MSDSVIPDGVWLVRGGINDEMVTAFQQKRAIALDWRDVGDLALIPSLEDFKARVFQQFRGNPPESIRDELKDLLWLVRLIDIGDYVLVDDKFKDEVVIGKVISDVEYNLGLFGSTYPYIRRVKWMKHIPRDLFTPEAQQDLYSILPVEDLRSHRREFHKRLTGGEGIINLESERVAPYQDIGVFKAFVRELAWELEDFLQSILDIASMGKR
jgi:predicted Mrr-cat superfamily restriction endonuclease